jgi:esterase/lipase superfamily enzyme
MHTEIHKWYSPNLGKEMELKIYGHYGQSFVVFPCSRGRYFDFEGRGMVDKISYFINSGKIKLFSIDSVDTESWYDFSILPGDRNARHEAYDRYVAEEVTPFIRNHCNASNERPMATGTSMGAYHSINYFLKHPDICGGTIALSGLYRLDRDEFKISEDDVKYIYYNSPVHYLPNINDPVILDWYKKSNIIVCCGQGAWEDEAILDTRSLEHSFRQIGVKAWIDFWGNDVNHDWPWWYVQMNYFLSKLKYLEQKEHA